MFLSAPDFTATGWIRFGNMTDPAVLKKMLTAINELSALYGHHPSFYGWYYPDETWINGHLSEEFMRYVNLSSAEIHKMDKRFRSLIGPYGTPGRDCRRAVYP